MFGDDVAEPLVAAVKGKRKRATAADGEDEAVIAPRPQKRLASVAAVAAASAVTAAAAASPPPPPPLPPAPPARKIRAAVSPTALPRMTRSASRTLAASRAVSVVSAAPAKKRGRPGKEEVEVAAPPAKKARKGKEKEISDSAPQASSAGVKKGKAPAKPKAARSRRPAARKGKGKERERVEEKEGLEEVPEEVEEEEAGREFAVERMLLEEQRVGSPSPTIKREYVRYTTAENDELYE